MYDRTNPKTIKITSPALRAEMRGSMKKRNKKMAKILAAVLAAALGVCVPETTLQAAETRTSVQIQMPGFVVEQFSAPRLMNVTKNAVVRTLPDNNAARLASVTAGNTVWGWGQTNTGWYFVQVGSQIGYVCYEAAAYATQEQIAAAQAAQQAAVAQQAAQAQANAAAQAQAAQQAQIAAAAANQPAVAAGIVFIGDSRMVTLKDAVERNLGSCAAAVVAKNGSRHEWLHDTGIPQADKIIGKGSRVIINMGVNDLSDADKYAKDVNYWAAVWSARGAQIYYASVNPVWANSYGMTEERVKLFNDRLKGQLIPQIIWLDSHDYLMGVGVHASDGVHYKDDTNLVLYQYYLSMIGAI